MRITLNELARRVGRSPSQVSRALSGRGEVSPELVRKVRRLAKECGYVPHGPARALRRGRRETIGILHTGWVPYGGEPTDRVTDGVQYWIERHAPRNLMFAHWRESDGRPSMVVRQHWVDGVILSAGGIPEVDHGLVDYGLPVVVVNMKAAAFPSVSCDNVKAARDAVDYLYGLGHRRIAYVGTYVGANEDPSTWQRLEGYRSACVSRGIEAWGAGHIDRIEECVDTLLSRDDPPTALLCYCDSISLEVHNCLFRRGLRVPEDMSIIGFDDSHVCRHSPAPLSTMRIPYFEMGYYAARMLEERIEDPDLPLEHVVLEAPLMARESTAPSPRAMSSANRQSRQAPLSRRSVSVMEGRDFAIVPIEGRRPDP